MFFRKSDIQKQKKMPPAGMLATEVRAGDAPKPIISMKTYEKFKKYGNQPQINNRNFSLFLNLFCAFRILYSAVQSCAPQRQRQRQPGSHDLEWV